MDMLLYRYGCCKSTLPAYQRKVFLCLPHIFKEQDDLNPMCMCVCVVVVGGGGGGGGGTGSFAASIYSSYGPRSMERLMRYE